MADVDLLVVEQHAVDGLDGSLSSLGSLVVNIAETTLATVLIGGNFAGQDIAEGSESVVEGLQGGHYLIIMSPS